MKQRFERLWSRTLGRGSPNESFDELERAYSSSSRFYHNFDHIANCLAEFDTARHLASHPYELEWALWFHDEVYNPQASDNEEESARMSYVASERAQLPPGFCALCV